MKRTMNVPQATVSSNGTNRRLFLKKSVLYGTVVPVLGMGLLSRCSEGSEEEISPPEDLMREHGVLRRVMFIYDHCRELLINRETFNLSLLSGAANIIRTFVEDYHERLEEDLLFPEFTGRNQMVQLVQALSIQHKVGRELTDEILRYGGTGSLADEEAREQLVTHLRDFNHMYRPHAAIEDTALFSALRNIVTKSEFYEMGENFEAKESELLGENGFETMVGRVTDMEKELGIDGLSQFTQQSPQG